MPRNTSEGFARMRITDEVRAQGETANLAWRHYGERLRPVLLASGFASLGAYLSRELAELDRPIEILSLGGGSGSHELALARSFSRSYRIRCVEVLGGRFDRAQAIAHAEGLAVEFSFGEVDTLELERGRYDLVVSRDLFHRVLRPRRHFEGIADALAPGGLLQIEDLVGKNHRILWEENEWLANALLSRLPERLTRGARLESAEGDSGPGGPCQEVVLEELRQRFEPLFELRHGAFMRFVCAHPLLGPALGAPDSAARNSLDFLIDSDDSAVRHELMPPLELWGVYRPTRAAGSG